MFYVLSFVTRGAKSRRALLTLTRESRGRIARRVKGQRKWEIAFPRVDILRIDAHSMEGVEEEGWEPFSRPTKMLAGRWR